MRSWRTKETLQAGKVSNENNAEYGETDTKKGGYKNPPSATIRACRLLLIVLVHLGISVHEGDYFEAQKHEYHDGNHNHGDRKPGNSVPSKDVHGLSSLSLVTADSHNHPRFLRRLPENRIPDREVFSFAVKERRKEHSRVMWLPARRRKRAKRRVSRYRI
jgi:hypothetical protein